MNEEEPSPQAVRRAFRQGRAAVREVQALIGLLESRGMETSGYRRELAELEGEMAALDL